MKAEGHFGPVVPDIDPRTVEWSNPDGDKITVQPLRFRCKGCGIGCQSVALPGTPLVAKYICRRCNYTTEVQTRESVHDYLDGLWDERGHMQKLEGRTSFLGGNIARPGMSAEVVEGKLVWVPSKKP